MKAETRKAINSNIPEGLGAAFEKTTGLIGGRKNDFAILDIQDQTEVERREAGSYIQKKVLELTQQINGFVRLPSDISDTSILFAYETETGDAFSIQKNGEEIKKIEKFNPEKWFELGEIVTRTIIRFTENLIEQQAQVGKK